MVALLRGEAIENERAVDSSIMTASGLAIVGLNPGFELVTSGLTAVLVLPELAAGGTSLKVTTPFSSTDL